MTDEQAHVMCHAKKIIALGWGDECNLIAIKYEHLDDWGVAGCREVWNHGQLMGYYSLTNSSYAVIVSDEDFEVMKRTASKVKSVGSDYMLNQSTCVLYFENPCLRPGDFANFCKSHPDFKWWGNR